MQKRIIAIALGIVIGFGITLSVMQKNTYRCFTDRIDAESRFDDCSAALDEPFTFGALRTYIRNQQVFAADVKEDYKAALPLAGALIAEGKERTFVHVVYGRALHSVGQHREALRAYREGLVRAPRSSIYLSPVVEEMVELTEFDEAREIALQFIEREPDLSIGHASLGWVTLKAGQPSDAIKLFQRALEIEPNNDHTHYLLAIALERTRANENAIAEYEKAIAIGGNLHGSYYIELADLLISLRRYGKALFVMDDALRRHPDSREAKIIHAALVRRLAVDTKQGVAQ